MSGLFGKLFPSRNDRLLKSYRTVVNKINALESSYKNLDDSSFPAKQGEFKTRLENGESLDQILPEAFALVREASRRVLNMRPFDVQLMGGIALHQGRIAEMSTGEGKTLVATMPAYLNALLAKGVHIVTVNDYLAKRDAEWMGQVYRFLGMDVGTIVSGQDPEQRHKVYRNDIIYGTNNEFGFDYLRDNMAFSLDHIMQREHFYAIIDEVDSVLIDEARTPLIISGPAEGGVDIYKKINTLVRPLKREQAEGDGGDYTVDEKSRQVLLTESGHQHIEELLIKAGLLAQSSSLYDMSSISLFHHVIAALRANVLFKKDIDYIVKDGRIMIVDEFTGRVMAGRRWSDGLHQAIEAKENVKVEPENQTLASITFQNYFRLYEKLSGMTGTADTEAYELQDIYDLEVVILPTHKPMVRDDMPDLVYMTENEKFDAITEDIKSCVENGQPVLAGTASIEVSERLSGLLSKISIKHQVLNAKHHEAESQIIAQAGRPAAVTIATNMAGRGTDIILGGALKLEEMETMSETKQQTAQTEWEAKHQSVIQAGGLHIIGTERHESRRIDNQLRGRSGRQGDPGSSRFYLSLEDNLMRIFASDKVKGLMGKVGMQEGEAIEHTLVTKAIENAQRKVEAHNYDIRKTLLEYDDVINEQRHIIYEQRFELMKSDDIGDSMETMLPEVIETIVTSCAPQFAGEEWNIDQLSAVLAGDFGLSEAVSDWFDDPEDLTVAGLQSQVTTKLNALYEQKKQQIGEADLRKLEHTCMLLTLDRNWKEHLLNIDYLRQGIGLRGFAQKNPKQEYKREAFTMFESMLDRIRYEFVTQILTLEIDIAQEEKLLQPASPAPQDLAYKHDPAGDVLHPHSPQPAEPAPPVSERPSPVRRKQSRKQSRQGREQPAKPSTVRRKHPKLGRNDPCFCGSNKKYKHCHGKEE